MDINILRTTAIHVYISTVSKVALYLLFALSFCGLSACRYLNVIPMFSSKEVDVASGHVAIGEHAQLRLLSPASLGRNVVITQEITFITSSTKTQMSKLPEGDVPQDKERKLLSQIEVSHDIMRIAVLTPSGIVVARIEWDGSTATVESRIKDVPFDISYLIADVQLALWPLMALKTAINGARIVSTNETEASRVEQEERKILYQDDTPLLTITKLSDTDETSLFPYNSVSRTIYFRHYERGYDISINTLSVQEL